MAMSRRRCTSLHSCLLTVALLLSPHECLAKKKNQEPSEGGADRMRAEISTDGTAQPTQSAEMAAEEMKARMGLAQEFTDVLTDIMGERC